MWGLNSISVKGGRWSHTDIAFWLYKKSQNCSSRSLPVWKTPQYFSYLALLEPSTECYPASVVTDTERGKKEGRPEVRWQEKHLILAQQSEGETISVFTQLTSCLRRYCLPVNNPMCRWRIFALHVQILMWTLANVLIRSKILWEALGEDSPVVFILLLAHFAVKKPQAAVGEMLNWMKIFLPFTQVSNPQATWTTQLWFIGRDCITSDLAHTEDWDVGWNPAWICSWCWSKRNCAHTLSHFTSKWGLVTATEKTIGCRKGKLLWHCVGEAFGTSVAEAVKELRNQGSAPGCSLTCTGPQATP